MNTVKLLNTSNAYIVLTSIMLTTPITLITSAWLNPQPQVQLVSFDLKQAVKQYSGGFARYLQQAGIENVPDILMDEKAKAYASILEEELARYASEQSVVIVVKSAIVNGAIDVTPEIERRSMARMNQQGTQP